MTATRLRRLLPAALLAALAAPAGAQTAPLHAIDLPGGGTTTLANGTTLVRCATPEPTAAERAAADAATARYIAGGAQRRYVVPIAMHIVATDGGSGMVPMSQIVDQIEVLNEAYRGGPFSFYLLVVDTTFNTAWHNTEGGADEAAMLNALAVRPTEVLNVYLRNPGAGLLGYAYFPTAGGATWSAHILYTSTPGGTQVPYNLGHTMTHEIGHNVGLSHTFSGGCGSGDGVADTPAEAGQTFSCPTQQDSCPADPGRDPIRNFMDYTDDICMFEFSPGQATRAAAQIGAFKPDLGESGQADDVQVDGIIAPERGPQPAGPVNPTVVIRNLGSSTLTAAEVAYQVLQGATVVASGTVPWTGSLAHAASADVALPTLNLAAGAYTLLAMSTLPGGALDSQPQNDSMTVDFALIAPAASIDTDWEAAEDLYSWGYDNPTGYVRNWTLRSGVIGPAGVATKVIAVRHFEFRIPGTRFDLVAPPVTVPPVGRVQLSFDFAYAPRPSRPQTFDIQCSIDGGATTIPVRSYTDAEVATRPAQTGSFQPTAAAHWQHFTLSLNACAPSAGDPSVELRIVFSSTDNDGNNRWMDNVVLEVGDARLVLTGEEGWRMLSAPTSGINFDDLLGPLWTQGFPWSDNPAAPEANVLGYDETVTGPSGGYFDPSSQLDPMGDGRGYLAFVYSDDDQDGTPEGFPKTLTASGGAPAGPVALPATFTESPLALPHADGWNLLGNPYPDPIVWSSVARTNVTPNVYVYDATAGGAGQFRVWNGAVGNLPGGLIPVGQGFWAKAHAVGPVVSVPESARYPNGSPTVPAATALTLHLEGTVGARTLSTDAFLTYDVAAAEGFDLLDAYTFVPLADDYLLLASRPDLGPIRASIDIRPLPAQGVSAVYALDVETIDSGATVAATLTLSWPTLATMPGDLAITMLDNETSTNVDLRAQSSYTFTSGGPALAAGAPGEPSILSAGGEGRFTLTVRRAGVATEGDPTAAFALQTASPNPFRGATAIAYSLDTASHVRLSVYDVLGRYVATLVDGERGAGAHAATLDGSTLRAGVYLVRLEADGVRGRQVATTRVVHAD